MGVFEDRCVSNPQGVINDLVKQTTKQGAEINRLNKLLEQSAEVVAKQAVQLTALGVIPGEEPTPEPKAIKKRGKKGETPVEDSIAEVESAAPLFEEKS